MLSRARKGSKSALPGDIARHMRRRKAPENAVRRWAAARRAPPAGRHSSRRRLGAHALAADGVVLDGRPSRLAAPVSRLRRLRFHEAGTRWPHRLGLPDLARRGSSGRTIPANAGLGRPLSRAELAGVENGRAMGVALLTATPGEKAQDAFSLDDEDRSNPVLKKRLE